MRDSRGFSLTSCQYGCVHAEMFIKCDELIFVVFLLMIKVGDKIKYPKIFLCHL